MKKSILGIFPATEEGFSQLLQYCRLSDDFWRAKHGSGLFQSVTESVTTDDPIWHAFLYARPLNGLCKVLFIRDGVCVVECLRRATKIRQVRGYYQYSAKPLLPFIYHIPHFIQAGWEPHSLTGNCVYLRKSKKLLEFYGYQANSKIYSKIWLYSKNTERKEDLIYSSFFEIPLLPPEELLAAIESGNLPRLPEPEPIGCQMTKHEL